MMAVGGGGMELGSPPAVYNLPDPTGYLGVGGNDQFDGSDQFGGLPQQQQVMS